MGMAASGNAPLPEGVTSVDEFIRPTHEPTLHGTLSVRQPVHELGQVQGVRATAQNRRGESAEGVPSVRLRAGLAGAPPSCVWHLVTNPGTPAASAGSVRPVRCATASAV